MIYHVNQSPGDGSLCRVDVYQDGQAPAVPNGYVQMTAAEFLAWITPLQTARAAADVAAYTAQHTAAVNEAAADATRRADAASVLSTLEANVSTDPANLTQASAQLRWIKRILLFLLKRALR